MQMKIFWAFFKVGMLGYGGGPASIPLVHKEVVDTYEWMTDEEFQDSLAIANVLPGPIITKLAGYIGFMKKGWVGMVNAVFAAILPTIILMIVLLKLFTEFKDLPWVQGMSHGVIPVVGVMLIILTYEFLEKAKAKTTWKFITLFTLVSFLLLAVLDIHPAIVILLIVAFSLFRKEGRI
ncbi:chromate transporter [Salinicoccus halodurans]|uniref:Chromate transporter n=1 Tax=Salinicoccus halodurans TaxID=407035 RepID=A0A0F7HMN9_9STAP|nr:chromate transporter [Salinicoccus halodurans]AKG74828.1 chromate transporter [Salinicoccus halodurans]SFK69744.1 chromate transporter [Salinicoccus halodurans]